MSWVLQAGILIKAGGKELVLAKDRWDRTPLDEAKRVQAQPLVVLLEQALKDESAPGEQSSSGHRWW